MSKNFLSTDYGLQFQIAEQMDPSWGSYDRIVATSHLTNYGRIFIDQYGAPIDNEYDLEEIQELLQKS